MFAKFDRPSRAPPKKSSTLPPLHPPRALIQKQPKVVNIEHHNEVYIFANSVVLPPEGKIQPEPVSGPTAVPAANYDFVTDQPGVFKAKSPITLNTLLDPAGSPHEKPSDKNLPSPDTFRMNPLQLSRPTPKFVTPASGSTGKHRFVFFCDTDGVTSQVIQQQSPINNRILTKRLSDTPSVTDHVDNPSVSPINL